MNDLRQAWRVLRRTPGFTSMAVLTLALGLGINTAIYTVVNAVIFRSLPYPEPERLVSVWETSTRPDTRSSVAGPRRVGVRSGGMPNWPELL